MWKKQSVDNWLAGRFFTLDAAFTIHDFLINHRIEEAIRGYKLAVAGNEAIEDDIFYQTPDGENIKGAALVSAEYRLSLFDKWYPRKLSYFEHIGASGTQNLGTLIFNRFVEYFQKVKPVDPRIKESEILVGFINGFREVFLEERKKRSHTLEKEIIKDEKLKKLKDYKEAERFGRRYAENELRKEKQLQDSSG